MSDPNLPYDLANAVRAAREQMADRLEMGVAGTLPVNPEDIIRPLVERLDRLIREHGHRYKENEPKPWKKPWDR